MHEGGALLQFGIHSLVCFSFSFSENNSTYCVLHVYLWFNFTIVTVWHFPLFWCMPTYWKWSNCTKGTTEPMPCLGSPSVGTIKKQAGHKWSSVLSFSISDPAPHLHAVLIVPTDREQEQATLNHNIFLKNEKLFLPTSKQMKQKDGQVACYSSCYVGRYFSLKLSTACYACTLLFSAIHHEHFPVRPFSSIVIHNVVHIAWSLKQRLPFMMKKEK